MAANNQALTVQIKADLSGFQKGLDQAAQKAQKIGTKLKSVGKDMSTFLTLPILAAGGAAIKMASDFEESANKVEVAFGGASNIVKDFAKTTLTSFGIAEGSALDMAALFGDMATSMGISQGAAANMSTQLVGLAGDLASFKNIRLDVAETALKSIFTGETESLKNLGIVMTQANLEAFALEQGMTKNLKAMSEAEKVQLRYNYVLSKTVNAQGDFERTGGGAANQMRIFQESLKQLGQEFGENILPLFTGVITKVNKAVQAFGNLSERTQNIIIGVAALVAGIGPLLVVLGTLGTIMPQIATAFALITSPISLTIAGIAGLSAAIIYLIGNWEAVTDRITDINWWKNALIDMVQFFLDYNPIELLITGFNKVLEFFGRETITTPFNKLSKSLEDLKVPVDDNKASFGSFGDALGDVLDMLGLVKKAAKDANESIEDLDTTTSSFGSTGNGSSSGTSNGDSSDWIDVGDVMETSIDELESYEEALEKTAEKNAALTQGMSQGFSQLGHSIVSNLGEAETAMGRFLRALARNAIDVISVQLAQSLANAITGATQSGTATGPMAAFTTPAFIASAIGGVIGAFAALPKFANGGIVNGSSFSGDRVMARVNSGEMILNRSQQASLFNMINRGGGSNERLVTQIAGNDLRVVLERAQKTNNRLR